VQAPAAFLLRWVLHDWPDSDCILILRQLAQNMGPESNLLINDVVVPPKGSVHPLREKYIRDMDIVMMSAFNSVERSIEEWTTLISQADPALKVVGVTTPHGSGMSMIQVRRVEN
jgi:6-hydroxytryprostatin B O-methyltransferase